MGRSASNTSSLYEKGLHFLHRPNSIYPRVEGATAGNDTSSHFRISFFFPSPDIRHPSTSHILHRPKTSSACIHCFGKAVSESEGPEADFGWLGVVDGEQGEQGRRRAAHIKFDIDICSSAGKKTETKIQGGRGPLPSAFETTILHHHLHFLTVAS